MSFMPPWPCSCSWDWPGAASAQSLGDLAAQEKQKRQGKPAPKVITEGDIAKCQARHRLHDHRGGDDPGR